MYPWFTPHDGSKGPYLGEVTCNKFFFFSFTSQTKSANILLIQERLFIFVFNVLKRIKGVDFVLSFFFFFDKLIFVLSIETC